jgi:hypothetical protein
MQTAHLFSCVFFAFTFDLVGMKFILRSSQFVFYLLHSFTYGIDHRTAWFTYGRRARWRRRLCRSIQCFQLYTSEISRHDRRWEKNTTCAQMYGSNRWLWTTTIAHATDTSSSLIYRIDVTRTSDLCWCSIVWWMMSILYRRCRRFESRHDHFLVRLRFNAMCFVDTRNVFIRWKQTSRWTTT